MAAHLAAHWAASKADCLVALWVAALVVPMAAGSVDQRAVTMAAWMAAMSVGHWVALKAALSVV